MFDTQLEREVNIMAPRKPMFVCVRDKLEASDTTSIEDAIGVDSVTVQTMRYIDSVKSLTNTSAGVPR